MSRHPVSFETEHNTRESKVAEEYANFMALQATPNTMTLEEIKMETKKMLFFNRSAHTSNNS